MDKLDQLLQEQQEKFASIDKNISDFYERESELKEEIRQKESEAKFDKYSLELAKATSALKYELNEIQTLRLQAENDRLKLATDGAASLKESIDAVQYEWAPSVDKAHEDHYLANLKEAAAKVIEICQQWETSNGNAIQEFVDKRQEFKPYLPTENLGLFFVNRPFVGLSLQNHYRNLGL